MASKIISMLDGVGTSLAQKGQSLLDGVFPPEKRAELLTRIKAFVIKNPKISAFLLTNVALSAGPLILFALFSLTVFVFALIVALVVALLAAVAFTLFAVGVALLILFPTVFFTTLTATFLFLWGLGGYYIFKAFNKSTPPGAKGDTIGDKLNALTGNKFDFVMDNARDSWISGQLGAGGKPAEPKKSPQNASKGQPNGTAHKHKKSNSSNSHKTDDDTATTSGADVKKRSDSPMDGVKSGAGKVANPDHVTNGVKSGANGVAKVANPDHVTDAADNVTKTAGLGEHTDRVKGAPRKLTQAPGQIKGTAVGSIGGATGLV
ncbi:hypothetical protein K461DRAFT_264985 [Myriangium duriaei CBS 260.36]|uniref:Uncharacterized protein n=1 Tax=Myriangium duriaei CBS 260.36 TaxID=1168546 RepID=A0A9P4JG42_9PEZI|nr:hypothetical protein K461DRAFT_264985 [Myriangium duriaei CBS 260.36]